MKIVIAGAVNCGKSTITNFLSQSEILENIYHPKEKLCQPTIGCRIAEMRVSNISVELWDTSGSHDFEKCWPAVMDGASALILVYNPEDLSQESEIELWHETFAKKYGTISDDHCLVLMYFKDQSVQENVSLPQSLQGCHIHRTDATRGKELTEYFTKFTRRLSLNNVMK